MKVLSVNDLDCKNSDVKFNTPGVVRGPHQVGVNFNTSRCYSLIPQYHLVLNLTLVGVKVQC